MLKGRGRDPRAPTSVPAHLARPPASAHLQTRPPAQTLRAPLAKPEPDYEVVEFPSDQYVNAKLQPPPPPPPRPSTGHPLEAGASCGLCGGGGARVRCAECGRRALCASCDDMYHRHPKRRHHQRQALSPTQMRDERPPLPPKTNAPVPPPRRHKLTGDRASASPRPAGLDQRRATIGHLTPMQNQTHPVHNQTLPLNNHTQLQMPAHLAKLAAPVTQHTTQQMGSMPYIPTNMPHTAAPMVQPQVQANTLAAWGRQRGSLQGFNMHPNMGGPTEAWESPEMPSSGQSSPWGRPLRRGASVLELGGAAGGACGGCGHCAAAWRYGSCASLEPAPWPAAWPAPACCGPHHVPPHAHMYTPQPYRRADSRAASRAASRTGSRAASPAMSSRSRASRRTKHRTPSPPPLPSSDADSESESDSDRAPPPPERRETREQPRRKDNRPKEEPRKFEKQEVKEPREVLEIQEDSLGPAPPPPDVSWQCEHCTFVNEPGVRVCAVCCRTPTAAPKAVEEVGANLARLNIAKMRSPSPARSIAEPTCNTQNGETTKSRQGMERFSTGCGPSPPREDKVKKPLGRLVTPTREQNVHEPERVERPREKHDMGVGPSPPRENKAKHNMGTGPSPPKESLVVRASPYREQKAMPPEPPTRHSVSVGPSPPRDNTRSSSTASNVPKKSAGTSPPRGSYNERRSTSSRNVSNTGTSPPPQSISTQTYEVPSSWDASSASRSRPRRRFRDDRRERSHSRHSLSSDTRESERSGRTSGGRWEWRERDSSPEPRAPRLARRASHLDLHRARPARRGSLYGSEAASPERLVSSRTLSLEALAGAGARRETERGLELAQLMTDAERLGFSAAEVHAALAQSPAAPLAWLRSRWPSLCAGVRAAAARLAPAARVSDNEARAALARHRGAMWPAVTDCVERHRRQSEALVGSEGRVRGRVWGSPVGADDDAAPPAAMRPSREDSSDEFEASIPTKYDDDWMYLPLDPPAQNTYDMNLNAEVWTEPVKDTTDVLTEDIALKLKSFLIQAGVPSINENLLLKGLLADNTVFKQGHGSDARRQNILNERPRSMDMVQFENDFIDAYNALTRSSPLPSINNPAPTSLKVGDRSNHSKAETSELNSPKSTDVDHTNINKNKSPGRHNLQTFENIEQNLNKVENELKERLNINQRINAQTDIPIEVFNKNQEQNTDVQTAALKREEHPEPNKIGASPERKIVPNTTPDHQSSKTFLKKRDKNVNSTVPMPTTSRQQEDKSSNLSDIVDNTQRLIQQMKEEINSDINSLDGHGMSQSEADNSSNESDYSSEHESSYSESHDETDNLTSDEKEDSSTEEDTNEQSQKSPTPLNRTSSEENEQFEEAMDHIEEQNENFKQTNIEILDSIARSLQEDHTITLELNRHSETIEPVPAIFESEASGQRFPNNIKDVEEQNIVAAIEPVPAILESEASGQRLPNNIKDVEEQNIVAAAEQSSRSQTAPKPATPKIKKKDINNNLRFVQANSFEEIYDELTSGKNQNTSNSISVQNKQTKRDLHPVINDPTPEPQPSKPSYEETRTPAVIPPKQDVIISTLNIEVPTRLIIINQHHEIYNGVIETIEDPIQIPASSEVNNTDVEVNNTSGDMPAERNNNESSESDEGEGSSDSSRRTVSPAKEINIEIKKNNEVPLESTNSTHVNAPSVNEEINTTPESTAEDANTFEDDNAIKTSPEKQTPITNKKKSHIPKFIKIFPSSKQKTDKSSPKVISSKVPVRRGSIKQYPAPAPPKTYFGNIQNGHVKQLQTRLFNNKTTKVVVPSTTKVEPVPSTSSTFNKKRPAPLPPSNTDNKLESPPKESKPYFRETCRTEDEWTESDSDESQVPLRKENSHEPLRAPSPPPPVTVRRVSGQMIDLDRVRLLEGSPERQARMLLAEGALENWDQAQLAVELVARGADPPAALLAALECADLEAALTYLYQDCELCASRLPEHEMVSMLRCTHRCCRECARHYFTVQITERSIADCVCPYCKEPELETLPEDAWLEYFAHLDILLKTLIEIDVHELFQRKLRDRTLAMDPNFRWCVECSSGFFVHPKQKKLRCPECKSISCATCRKPWTQSHEGLSCEQYAKWLEDNDPERSVAAVQQHLRENGLDCPRCHFKYSLSRGGCMHFTCTQCKYEFCYGCGKPFMMGARCGLSEYCARLGLHAHHPRNCLFYLRDKEPHELQTLLQMNNVSFETEAPEGSTKRCPVQLQKETPTGLIDAACGSEVPPNHAGLCKNHYLEYLSRLVRARRVEPLPLLGVDDLETLAALRGVPGGARAPARPHPHHGRERAGCRAAAPRAAAARARALGHRPHLRGHVRRDCQRKNTTGINRTTKVPAANSFVYMSGSIRFSLFDYT
ncbi:E3 ubiquitin-protein ligase lubel isoform X2 [Pectinophora gossypiella]|uniref:E3 ubiquitin-protein ligase lubel isoform X2 n=1 Tax=Pectinophora gossypiella TaxID=13191 RepID=UPI00214EC0CF|nr:E3 ubiquitin-protein ligase lubel isoform X2 [Pectinophora gossypiella]